MSRSWRRIGVAMLAACATLIPGLPGDARAGTTGRLTGTVRDAKKQPLASANIGMVGVPLGAASQADGRYTVLNIPSGTYGVRVQLIGYGPSLIQNVVISADQTTTLDVALEEAAVEVAEVVVSAQRPVVDVNLTSNIASVTRQEIANLPVQELADIVNLQAGVVDGHFRGGRLGEVQYQVDGVTMNNSFDNTATVKLDRSLLEEVQVISGTFDAEYGQAMSGVVNAVLRRGGPRFEWSGEAFLGSYLFDRAPRGVFSGGLDGTLDDYQYDPGVTQNYQVTGSGPVGLPNVSFLANLRRYANDDYVTATRVFEPTDSTAPGGDFGTEPLGTLDEWSGLAKLSWRLKPGMELSYQAVGNRLEERRSNDKYAYLFAPNSLSRQQTNAVAHGLDWTHTLSPGSFYKLALRHNHYYYRDRIYDDFWDARYDAAGPIEKEPSGQFVIEGVDFNRFVQRSNTYVLNASATSQVRRDHLVKVGGEFQWPYLTFGNDGWLTAQSSAAGREEIVRHQNEPPTFPGLQRYRPVIASAFGQDEIEWNDLRIRAGLRYEFFDAKAIVPSDPSNPANAIAGAPESKPKDTSNKVALMPRIGVSHPITSRASVFFAYGHFTQMPPLRDMFTDADYSVLSNLQAATTQFDVMGNPDIKPELTVQYQFGYKQALSDVLGLDFTVFYKDIRDLLGVEFVSTYNDAEYARFTNADFGNVTGFTVALDQRPIGLISATLDYTWQVANGNTSDPRETATRAEAGEDPRPELVPLNWDQRHTLNLTLTVARPERWSGSAIARFASGQPYTPLVSAGFGGGLEHNSGRKPASFLVDLRGERRFGMGQMGSSLFLRVFNVFDTRFFNGDVFASTGDPYYSNNPADENTLEDPTRYYGPRRVELGFTLNGAPR